jgi:hypothetical protein
MQTNMRDCNMRVDNDTYVWGVKKIVIERNTSKGHRSTRVKFIGADEQDANANLTVWGDFGSDYVMPEIVFKEDDGEERVLVPCDPQPEPAPAGETKP